MKPIPATATEIDVDADELTLMDAWLDERTVRIDFDEPVLSCEAKLVFAYLTMEHHGAFAELSSEEQRQFVDQLMR